MTEHIGERIVFFLFPVVLLNEVNEKLLKQK